MRLINNTNKILYYYIEEIKYPNILYFSQQIESIHDIKSFIDRNDWINYVNSSIGDESWLSEELKNVVLPEKFEDLGYLTKYDFRLSVDDETENNLCKLISSNDQIVEVTSNTGHLYQLSKNDFMELLYEYSNDKPLYLQIIKGC
jgi:hypothetical protein